jgi:hypothetical protein
VTAPPEEVEGLAPGASCAWPAWQRLSRNATNTNGRYCPGFSFRVMCANLQSRLARSTPNNLLSDKYVARSNIAGYCAKIRVRNCPCPAVLFPPSRHTGVYQKRHDNCHHRTSGSTGTEMSGRDLIDKRPLHRLIDFAASELESYQKGCRKQQGWKPPKSRSFLQRFWSITKESLCDKRQR